MAFTTRRGRPAKPRDSHDPGTPEFRFKHAHGLTAEPIDLCLERQLISAPQHRSGLHLRWLYTLRYGAPSLTTRYVDAMGRGAIADDPAWRSLREREYREASRLLKTHHLYEPVMRLAVYNETPAFLNATLRHRAWSDADSANRLHAAHQEVQMGLELLARLWRKDKNATASGAPQQAAFY